MDYYSKQNHGCRIRQFTHRGHNLLSMENSLIRITVLLDKGADIIEFTYKPKDIDLMWRNEDGLLETSTYLTSATQNTGAYFDVYPGGWQEILPGGGPMNYLGAEVGLHGEISLRPWEYAVKEDTVETIKVLLTAKTLRFPFAVKKTILLKNDDPTVYFEEELLNESRQAVEYMWAQHPCFGKPFIEPGCYFRIPARKFMTSPGFHTDAMIFEAGFTEEWPYKGQNGEKIDYAQEENSGIVGFYHFSELTEGQYRLYNKNRGIGFEMNWDSKIFPYVTSWQDYNGSMDFPYYGKCYNATFELWNTPTDSFETAKNFGTIPTLQPEESIATAFSASIFAVEGA